MKKMTKVWTIVAILMIGLSGNAHANKIKNPTFKKVRKSLWYMGVSGPSMEEVEHQIEEESKNSNTSLNMPEELSKALKKASGE